MYTGLQKNAVSLHPGILCFTGLALFYLQQPLNNLDDSVLSSSDITLFSKSITINWECAPAVFMHVCPC